MFTTCRHERTHQTSAEVFERDWDRMGTFYDFPREWVSLIPIEEMTEKAGLTRLGVPGHK